MAKLKRMTIPNVGEYTEQQELLYLIRGSVKFLVDCTSKHKR